MSEDNEEVQIEQEQDQDEVLKDPISKTQDAISSILPSGNDVQKQYSTSMEGLVDLSCTNQDDLSPFNLNQIEMTGIFITIPDSVKQGSGYSEYTAYNIRGTDKHGDFDTNRRFSEFDNLYHCLRASFPGLFIPPVPEKKIANKGETFVEDRKKFLIRFLNQIASYHYIYYSDIFQEFLRSKDINISQRLQYYVKDLKSDEYLQVYRQHFAHLQDKTLDTECIYKIQQFSNQLRKTKNYLQGQLDKIYEIADSKQQYNMDNSKLQEIILKEFEETLMLNFMDYNNKNSLFQKESTTYQSLKDTASKIKFQIFINSFEYLQDLIRFEINDINSMLQSISEKDNFEKKVQNASTIQKNAELELQKTNLKQGKSQFEIDQLKQQVGESETKCKNALLETENLKLLRDFIISLLVFQEIRKFKEEKQRVYSKLLNVIAEIEIVSLRSQQQFFRAIAEKTETLIK